MTNKEKPVFGTTEWAASNLALESFIDMNHELVLLSKQIDWEAVESEFAEYS